MLGNFRKCWETSSDILDEAQQAENQTRWNVVMLDIGYQSNVPINRFHHRPFSVEQYLRSYRVAYLVFNWSLLSNFRVYRPFGGHVHVIKKFVKQSYLKKIQSIFSWNQYVRSEGLLLNIQ